MKKVISSLFALVMIAALTVSVSAAAIDNLPAEREIPVAHVELAPKIDGKIDDIYGAPLWDFSGADAWAVDSYGGAEADYPWNLWPDTFEETESAEAAKATRFSGYAVWNNNFLYMLVRVDMGANPFYFNPSCEWQGNGIQFSLCPADAWVDKLSQVSYGVSLADAVTMSGKQSKVGLYEYTYEKLASTSTVLYDGASIVTYEFGINLDEFHVTVEEGLQILFCVSCNINVADDLSTDDFNGYQVGIGVFNGKDKFGESHVFVLSGGAEAPDVPVIDDPAPAPEDVEPDAPVIDDPAPAPASTADVSAVMYALAALSTVVGAVVLKRK